MLGMCKVSPLLCPFMSSGNWSHRAHRVSKVHPKPYVGNKEFWIKLGTPKCQSTLPFRNNIAKANGSHCKREVLGQRNQGMRMLHKDVAERMKQIFCPMIRERGYIWMDLFFRKKTILESKNSSLQPLIIQLFILIQCTNTCRSTEI